MNIDTYVKYIKKEFMYDYYTNVIKDAKEYDKITRKKICLEILNHIKDINNFTSLITYKEYVALTHLCHNNYQENERSIYRQLSNRLLCIFESNATGYVILDEYKDIIQTHLECLDVEILKKREKFDIILPAIIDVYGILSIEHLKKCLKYYLPSYHDHLSLFESTDNYLQYYSYDLLLYQNLILDKKFEEYHEEMQNVYEKFNEIIKNNYFIPEKNLLSIKENGLNLNLKLHDELDKKLNEFPNYAKERILNILHLYVHLQLIIDEDTYYYGNAINHLLPLIQKAAYDLPSAMFHGLTEKQFLKKYPKFKNDNKAKLKEDDAFLFFKLYFSLLEYTNNTYHLQPKLKKYINKLIYLQILSCQLEIIFLII